MSEVVSRFALERFVVLRTANAGVHVGLLVARSGEEAVLKHSRRIWNWKGRNTLSEIAAHGVGKGSRVSEMLDEALIRGVIEVLPCTPEAVANLQRAGWTE